MVVYLHILYFPPSQNANSDDENTDDSDISLASEIEDSNENLSKHRLHLLYPDDDHNKSLI